MKREQNKINQKLDGLKAPMNKEAFWERMQQLEDFPKQKTSKNRRGWWYGLLFLLLVGLGALTWGIQAEWGPEGPEAARTHESVEPRAQGLQHHAPTTEAMKTTEFSNKSTADQQASTVSAPNSSNLSTSIAPSPTEPAAPQQPQTTKLPKQTPQQTLSTAPPQSINSSTFQQSNNTRKDTKVQSSSVPKQAPNLNRTLLHNSDHQNAESHLEIDPIPTQPQNANTSVVDPADSIAQIKAPRANHLQKKQQTPPTIKTNPQTPSLANQQPPTQLPATEALSTLASPAQQTSIALSKQLDNSDIPLLDHQRMLPEHLRHLKLIPKAKNHLWAVTLSAGIGYTHHQLSADSTREIDDFNYRNANSRTLESYIVDLELSRQVMKHWTLALSLQYRQDHQRFRATYTGNETYTPNAQPDSIGFFSKTADRITHEHFHRYRTLQWGLSLGRRTNIGQFQLEYMVGLGTQLSFKASGQLLDASNTQVSLNDNQSYENSWRPFYFGQVRLVRPISKRLALIGDLRVQSTLRWTRKDAAIQHKATPIVAKIGIRFSF